MWRCFCLDASGTLLLLRTGAPSCVGIFVFKNVPIHYELRVKNLVLRCYSAASFAGPSYDQRAGAGFKIADCAAAVFLGAGQPHLYGSRPLRPAAAGS